MGRHQGVNLCIYIYTLYICLCFSQIAVLTISLQVKYQNHFFLKIDIDFTIWPCFCVWLHKTGFILAIFAEVSDVALSPIVFFLNKIQIVYNEGFFVMINLVEIWNWNLDVQWIFGLQGQAVIIAAYSWHTQPSEEDLQGFNEGLPINYLIAAPTMRIPQGVENTVNAYLAFRAVILAGTQTHTHAHTHRQTVQQVLV